MKVHTFDSTLFILLNISDFEKNISNFSWKLNSQSHVKILQLTSSSKESNNNEIIVKIVENYGKFKFSIYYISYFTHDSFAKRVQLSSHYFNKNIIFLEMSNYAIWCI